jgi:hypothetical protein
MSYKILVVDAVSGFGADFQDAADRLAELVNEHILSGWTPLGGVAVGETMSTKEPHLLQAMVSPPSA